METRNSFVTLHLLFQNVQVRIESAKPTLEQAALLEKVEAGFKALKVELDKVDNDPHLEDQAATTAMMGIIESLRGLNKESLHKLYTSLEMPLKPFFFSILGHAGTSDAVTTVNEIYTKGVEEADETFRKTYTVVPRFY